MEKIMNFDFRYADKQEVTCLFQTLFEILHANMSKIAPTGNSYEYDLDFWKEAMSRSLQSDARKIILMYDKNLIIGYFMYTIQGDTLMMEDIQIREAYHGSGLFRSFYRWLISELPDTLEYVETYVSKKNYKSQAVNDHLGLTVMGENKTGLSFHYRGKYKTLADLYR